MASRVLDDDPPLQDTQATSRLSLVTTIGNPPSFTSPLPTMQSNSPSHLSTSPKHQRSTPRSPRHHSPGAMSIDLRSTTPSLHRKASMNSLHGKGNTTPKMATPSRRSSAQYPGALDDLGEAVSQPTPASFARAHFETELQVHAGDQASHSTDTVAIIHDACYGHRFSRPRTSRASLSTIVERPERMQACVLGLSVAYVRLGGRYTEGSNPLQAKPKTSAIATIPFRIQKSTRKMALSSPAVTNVHGVKWMEELKLMCDNAEARLAMNGKELTRPDMPRPADQKTPAKLHEGDLYLCAESLEAMEGAVGAVCDAVDAVFEGSATGSGPHRAFVTIRPPGHHCSASYPSGFCWVNNVHVGISHAALAHGLTHAAIIDFDLHHGDGSQAITWDHNQRALALPKNALPWKRSSIGYFSLHDINSYPCEMGDEEKVKNASLCIENAHGQSIWNVHLHAWKSEKEFWQLYEDKYSVLLEKTRSYLRAQTERLRATPNALKPKAAIFLSAGFDASEWESAGMQRHKVNVPTEFYARLARDVVALACEEETAAGGRVISVLEGGYSDRALSSGVLSHLSGLTEGKMASTAPSEQAGLGAEMLRKIGALSMNDAAAEDVTLKSTYDPSWWSASNLDLLDAALKPVVAVETKKARDRSPSTYSSPTTSSKAKLQTPRLQRSVSNLSGAALLDTARTPSPPPPDVSWTIAAHELAKLLIPSDRQVDSCKAEELSAEATRIRRNRQSEVTPIPMAQPGNTEGSTKMALRVRKPARSPIAPVGQDIPVKPAARAGRRKTVAGTAVMATTSAPPAKSGPGFAQPTQQSTRRLSVASNPGSLDSITSAAPAVKPSSAIPQAGSVAGARSETSMSSIKGGIPGNIKAAQASVPRSEVKVPRARRTSPAKSKADKGNDTVTATKSSPRRAAALSGERKLLAVSKASPASVQSDIDALSSSMKKVKISLTTQYQRDARAQMEKKQASPVQTASVAENSSAAKQALKTGPAVSALAPSTPTEGSQSATASSKSAIDDLMQATPTPSTDLGVSDVKSMHNMHAPDLQATFVAYNPEETTHGQTNSSHMLGAQQQQQQPLVWLPPNVTQTPVTSRDGTTLPVWNSTGAIPFAVDAARGDETITESSDDMPSPTAQMATAVKPETQPDSSIWDVPVTPKTLNK